MQSEQLPTRLFIRTGEHNGTACAAGMLLQIMPAQPNNVEDLSHLAQLTATVKSEELFGLPANEVLYRLYHQEEVTLYEPQDVTFRCTCSRERSASALLTVPVEELNHMLEEDGNIDMHCEYCGNHYVFDKIDIESLFAGGQSHNEDCVH